LANILTGNEGNNKLDGGAGADTMVGGEGSDTYVVDNAGDKVTETGKAGIDLVQSFVTFSIASLGAVENVELLGSQDVNATGNALANHLTGNTGSNRLDGGKGADEMVGGLGNDTYVVDDAKDVVTEAAGGGIDTAETLFGVDLTKADDATRFANVENF